mgnify:CR=1 FL=1
MGKKLYVGNLSYDVTSSDLEQLLAFVRAWGRESPLVLHCWAGISRSS